MAYDKCLIKIQVHFKCIAYEICEKRIFFCICLLFFLCRLLTY